MSIREVINMGNEYSNIVLNTLLDEVQDIPPKLRVFLQRQNIKNIYDLLMFVQSSEKSSKRPSLMLVKTRELVNRILSANPELSIELDGILNSRIVRNIDLSKSVFSLDWSPEVAEELKRINISTISQVIDYTTEAALRRKGVHSKVVINKILADIERIVQALPALKIEINKRQRKKEEERQNILKLPVAELKWIPLNLRKSLAVIGVKTLEEFADVHTQRFINTEVEDIEVREIVHLAEMVKKYLEEDGVIEDGIALEASRLIAPFNVREFAPWWIKELYRVGIYNIKAIIDCGGIYELEKKGIGSRRSKYSYAKDIWNMVEALSKESPEIKAAMLEKDKERLKKRNVYERVPLENLINLPSSFALIVKELQLSTVGEVLNLSPESLIGKVTLLEAQQKEIFDYIKRLRVFYNNCDLEVFFISESLRADASSDIDQGEGTTFKNCYTNLAVVRNKLNETASDLGVRMRAAAELTDLLEGKDIKNK